MNSPALTLPLAPVGYPANLSMYGGLCEDFTPTGRSTTLAITVPYQRPACESFSYGQYTVYVSAVEYYNPYLDSYAYVARYVDVEAAIYGRLPHGAVTCSWHYVSGLVCQDECVTKFSSHTLTNHAPSPDWRTV